jgi:4-hydroxy-2-oxoheptanedioate aldolase
MSIPTAAPGAGPRLGPWIKLPSPMSMEAVLAAGADFVCIDMCNGWLGVDRVADLLAFGGTGTRLVRLAADAGPEVVGQLLDAGADGIVIPHITSVGQARDMVGGALFAPEGSRGMGSTGRAGGWGLQPTADYLATGRLDGRPPHIAIMIESAEAAEVIDELAAIPGVTQLLIGSADLGLALDHDADRVARVSDEVVRACAKFGLSAAIATGTAPDAVVCAGRGFDTIYLSNDLTLLARSARDCLAAVRSAVSPAPGSGDAA